MNDNFGEIVRYYLKHRIPLACSILLVVLFCMPLDFFEFSGLRPQVSLICVYYWVEKRPYMFGYISAFILGLLVDVCSTTPLGINCLLLMIFTFALDKVFYYIRPASFVMDWLLFALMSFIFMILKWLIFALYFGSFLDLSSISLNVFSTITFYPLIAYINNLIQLNLLPQERINE